MSRTTNEFRLATPRRKTRDVRSVRNFVGYCDFPDQTGIPTVRHTAKVLWGAEKSDILYEDTQHKRFGECHQTSFKLTPLVGGGSKCVVHNNYPPEWGGVPHVVEESPCGMLPWVNGTAGLWEAWPGFPSECRLPFSPRWEPLDIDSLLARGIEKMNPEIEERMSLLVTLAELKDLKTLFAQPIKMVKELNFKSFSAKSATKTLARLYGQGHLWKTFGADQIRKDLTGLVSAYYSVATELRNLLARADEVWTSHYSPPLETLEDEQVRSGYIDHNWTSQCVWSSQATRRFTVTVKYRYTVKDALGNPVHLNPRDADLFKAQAWLDAMGVNADPSLLWDVIPFSFVVDWIVPVGDWLESYEKRGLNAHMEWLDACYSIKTVNSADCSCTRWALSAPSNKPVGEDGTVCGYSRVNITEKNYDRYRFSPADVLLREGKLSLESSNWAYKAITGLSLISANLRR